MYWLIIISILVGIYDGFRQLYLVNNGLKSGIAPSTNLVNYLFFDKLD
jgi:hypothetical protein